MRLRPRRVIGVSVFPGHERCGCDHVELLVILDANRWPVLTLSPLSSRPNRHYAEKSSALLISCCLKQVTDLALRTCIRCTKGVQSISALMISGSQISPSA